METCFFLILDFLENWLNFVFIYNTSPSLIQQRSTFEWKFRVRKILNNSIESANTIQHHLHHTWGLWMRKSDNVSRECKNSALVVVVFNCQCSPWISIYSSHYELCLCSFLLFCMPALSPSSNLFSMWLSPQWSSAL